MVGNKRCHLRPDGLVGEISVENLLESRALDYLFEIGNAHLKILSGLFPEIGIYAFGVDENSI